MISTTSPSGEGLLPPHQGHPARLDDAACTVCPADHACMHACLLTSRIIDSRLFDINPKGTVPIIHDLEADKWVPGAHAH